MCVTPRHRPRYVNRHTCPVCKRPLINAPIDGAFSFPPLKHRVFEAIRQHAGITVKELAMLIYENDSERERTLIRVHVNQMRKELEDASDFRIRHDKRKFGYWVESVP